MRGVFAAYAWRILVHTRDEAKSVDALSDACDADPSTIYRRIERLQDADLLTDDQLLDPDGHHYKMYAANLDAVHVSLDADGFEVDVERREAPADRFTRLYEGFKRPDPCYSGRRRRRTGRSG